jgi:hypothetical protein
VNKSFNKPVEYAAVLDRLAKRDIYAITSFIVGLDNDTPGVADRTLEQIATWPPGLPVFGQLTPFPATPLYDRLLKAGRLTRPKHWLEFAPYQMANTPLKITVDQTHAELERAWTESYSPQRNASALDSIADKPIKIRVMHFAMRMFFRGIYFPQMTKRAWIKLVVDNRRSIFKLVREGIGEWRATKKKNRAQAAVPNEASI